MKEIKVDEVVSPGFGSQKIEGIVWAISDLEELEKHVKNPPGNILAVPHLYWPEWFTHVVFLEQFDAVLADTETSVLCHAAIIMREIGFVCITVTNLLEQVKNGDRIRITIERSRLRRVLEDLFYNIQWRKNLLKYPRGASSWLCKVVILD